MKKFHVAIIMDGNGRWAKLQGKSRSFGHVRGAKKISQVVQWAQKSLVTHLTLFAFSCENWDRPALEVHQLLGLLKKNLADPSLLKKMMDKKIAFNWIGFSDKKMPKDLVKKLINLSNQTKGNDRLTLTIAFNYGGQQDLMHAAKLAANGDDLKPYLLTKDLPPVDLLIRTGNEKRISNFLLWDIAYAEIIFQKAFWPAYSQQDWQDDLKDFFSRQRRFGKV